MHKISNLTGFGGRHGLDKVTPAMLGSQKQQQQQQVQQQQEVSSGVASGFKGPRDGSAAATASRPEPPQPSPLSLSFNVPFSSGLAGPERDDVIHATPGGFEKWIQPEGTDDTTPIHQLPVHTHNVETLRNLCRSMSEKSDGKLQASVTASESKPIPGLQLGGPSRTLVTNVCLSGEPEFVRRMRCKILHSTPISLRCAHVDIDQELVLDPAPTENPGIRASVIKHMDYVASWTGTDIFLLRPKSFDAESASINGDFDNALDQRFRIAIFGDMESAEHAKTRILIMIDQILKRRVDVFKLELTMHTMICGRLRRHVKLIESATNTAIYFPPPFPQIYGYCPPGANRRRDDEIFITGNQESDIFRAKAKLHELARHTQACVKEIRISADKLDNIVLERLDKIQKIMEYNGSYILFPQLGVQRGTIRVQGTDMLHVERTIREVMAISGQFYGASWWITLAETNQRAPSTSDVKSMLADICISSGAEIGFEKLAFHITGSDDAVKAALWIINSLPFVKKAQSHLRVRIELANEHKEFVSGKKNGKINKIMSHSNVQIYFDLFNEYNFFIDVSGPNHDSTKNGLDLVEQEMPASIAFHVPDQYHKRIIGIGGQHIQRIMKKWSVFVKFSNAMDRGSSPKEDDDVKVDNVICRTPARNAQNLDLVKQEIMEMVEKVDAEFVTEQVMVNRLYHRELLARMNQVETLEKKWNCRITFPSTEQASDVVTFHGPEYQVPQAVDEFLGMVPENHEISIKTNDELAEFFASKDFQSDVQEKLRTQYEVVLHVHGLSSASAAEEVQKSGTETLNLAYTRNNAGGLKDCVDFLTSKLVAHGLDASTIKGAIPRPKSDSFEDSLPFFESKLLHRPGDNIIDSPTRSNFGEETGPNRSFLDKLRGKPGTGTFSSFLAGRKSSSRSPSAPNAFAKYASSNASKASLVSLESQGSGFQNPWNASTDSGLGMDEDNGGWPARFSANTSTSDLRSPAFGVHLGGSSASLVGSSTALPPPGSSHGLPHPSNPNGGMNGLNGFNGMNGVNGMGTSFTAGDATPKYDPRFSHDSGRPSTSNSANGLYLNMHPGPIGQPARTTQPTTQPTPQPNIYQQQNQQQYQPQFQQYPQPQQHQQQ